MKDENQDVTNSRVRTTKNGFPINHVSFSGILIGLKELKNGEALSFGISQPKENTQGGQKQSTVLNVYVNGAANVEMFKSQIDEFNANGFKKTGSDQLLSPLVMVKGISSFSNYKDKSDIEHSSVTIIANDWTIPTNEKQLNEFRKTYNGNNPEQNEISIVGFIGSAVEISKKGEVEYARMSVAHNYKIGKTGEDEESKVMWMNVYVPAKLIPEIKNLNLDKGSSINLRGKIATYTYSNEKGNSQRVTLNATSISSNMTNVIAQAKATEKVKEFAQDSLGNIANLKNTKERVAKSEELKTELDKLAPSKPKL